MGRIAIVSAMHEELHLLLGRMAGETPVRRAGREFWLGRLHGHEVVAVLSRIGKVAAATTATLLLTEFGAKRILFTGTAGGLGEGVRVGDVVVADALLQHDMDASPLFPRHEVPLYGLQRFGADVAMSEALVHAATRVLCGAAERGVAMAYEPRAPGVLQPGQLAAFGIEAPRVHRGLLVSGDRFVSGREESAALRAELPQALAVEMEGAALAQVCHDFQVPFAVVRTVSDRADDSAHLDFGRFVDGVASHYSLAIVETYLHMNAAS